MLFVPNGATPNSLPGIDSLTSTNGLLTLACDSAITHHQLEPQPLMYPDDSLDPTLVGNNESLLGYLSPDFDAMLKQLTVTRNWFHDQLAQQLQAPLNNFAATMQTGSAAEKSYAASTINGIVKSLGLAVRCPITGRPALLVSDTQDSTHRSLSRFRFETRNEDGTAKRSGACRNMPQLVLVQDHGRDSYWVRKHQIRSRGTTSQRSRE